MKNTFKLASRKIHILLVLVAGMYGAFVSNAAAQTIDGPTLNENDFGYQYSGIGFTANVNSFLTGFTFQNQGSADTIILVDPLGNILDSISTPPGTPSDAISVHWALTSGDQYYLLQSTLDNGLYANWGLALPANIQITMTDSGVWSHASPVSTNFYIGGPSGDGSLFWGDFNNIETSSNVSATPEIGTMLLTLSGALAFAMKKLIGR
ncbi:MAG TPA: hypothetical protein VMH89_09170 [Candidatus Acidoferrum sp.]|nr:hypothetical protein [Candidatus Acidoferrum sp.]